MVLLVFKENRDILRRITAPLWYVQVGNAILNMKLLTTGA